MEQRGIIGGLITFWVVINLALWGFGMRDTFWPPWPWKTDCQKLEARYLEEGLVRDHGGGHFTGSSSAMEDLEARGCIELEPVSG